MKKSLFITIALFMALVGCQDDNLTGKDGPAAAGEEVQFAVTHADFEFNGPETKTIYGERDGNSYPIYWVNGDQIGIFCPQGSSPDNTSQHDYQVLVENETSSEGVLAKVNAGENGLQWGDGDVHDFYAIYPASASEGGMSATEVKCNIPLRQDPLRIEYDEATGTYTAYPNMNNAYMYAHTQVSRETQGSDPISLTFKPLVTVLEITVNGPTATPQTGDYQISQVAIRSQENITGEFVLTVADDPNDPTDGQCTPINNGTVSNLLTIPTYYNGEPVTLKLGEKLVVKAFMLPYASPDISTTSVTVNMVGSGSKTKTLSTADIEARKVNITSLPALPTVNDVNTYYWLSAMDKRTYFSQLSIPGSHNSYSIADNPDSFEGRNTQMEDYQTLSIEQQFAFGARAFSFMVGFDRDEAEDAVSYRNEDFAAFSNYTNWNNDYDLYVYDGGTQTPTTLESALDSYVTMLSKAIDNYPVEGRECQEFIVLNIDYKQITGSGNNNENKYREVRRWIREVDRILNNYTPANGIEFETNIGQNTTIADLMKKIVIFVNYQAPTLPVSEGASHSGLAGGEDYEGYTYTPLNTNNYIFMRKVYNENGLELTDSFWGLNDRDIDYAYYLTPEGAGSDIQIWKQTLQRLDNPYVTGYPNADEFAGRIQKKISIAESFFQMAIGNNTQEGTAGLNQWYINDLGGFCTVNESGSYNLDNGESGNTVVAANRINGPIYNYLINPENNSGPLGVVLMNFLGAERINDQNEANMNVYGEWLPQTVIENNFRFSLKRAE